MCFVTLHSAPSGGKTRQKSQFLKSLEISIRGVMNTHTASYDLLWCCGPLICSFRPSLWRPSLDFVWQHIFRLLKMSKNGQFWPKIAVFRHWFVDWTRWPRTIWYITIATNSVFGWSLAVVSAFFCKTCFLQIFWQISGVFCRHFDIFEIWHP